MSLVTVPEGKGNSGAVHRGDEMHPGRDTCHFWTRGSNPVATWRIQEGKNNQTRHILLSVTPLQTSLSYIFLCFVTCFLKHLYRKIITDSCLVKSSQLFETPEAVAHQAPLSMGFPREEQWSGLPFPSPMPESEVAQSCPTLSDPHGPQPTRPLHPWDFPGKSTGVGCLHLYSFICQT